MAELKTRLLSRSVQLRIALTLLLPALASIQTLPSPISTTARPPAPKLTVTPQHQIFIVGESVTLTCSVPRTSTLSGIRFFRGFRKIHCMEQSWSPARYIDSIQPPGVSGPYTEEYSCEYWKSEGEIPSERSQPISIAVTDPPSQPELSVDLPSGILQKGLSLNITCMAPGGAGKLGFHFYKDGVEIIPDHLGSKISNTDPGISSVNTSVLTILKADPNNTGEYTCRYRNNVSGRWVLSLGSRALNITVSGINTAGSYLWVRDLVVGGSFFLINGLIFLVTHWCF